MKSLFTKGGPRPKLQRRGCFPWAPQTGGFWTPPRTVRTADSSQYSGFDFTTRDQNIKTHIWGLIIICLLYFLWYFLAQPQCHSAITMPQFTVHMKVSSDHWRWSGFWWGWARVTWVSSVVMTVPVSRSTRGATWSLTVRISRTKSTVTHSGIGLFKHYL